MKENIDNGEKMMPFRVHDIRWSSKAIESCLVIGCGDSDPPLQIW